MGNCCSVSIPIDKLIPDCIHSISTQVKYATEFQEILRKLRNAMDELNAMKDDVNRKTQLAKGPRKKRLDRVQGWISRVESLETEVRELISSSSNRDVNYWRKYKLGKKLKRKTEDVVDLKSKGDFQELVEDLPPPVVDLRPIERTVGMETMLDEVWKQLQEEDVGMMGLFGLGGVGKTTLLKQINNKFVDASLDFDVVIWIVVSKNPIMERIQHDIGKKIGLHSDTWEKKSLDDKAIDIYVVLSNKKYVLLLDDVWERINLSDLGIPLPDGENKCKITFTTRCEKVCSNMGSQKKIRVECLSWEKSWDLFREQVGEETLNSDPEIVQLAQLVAQECGGLPLALITIGRAMTCKQMPQEWEHAIHMLRNVTIKFPGMENEVFGRLNFSYENLPSQTIQSCFLYCSLFPEDFEINKEELINMWIGEKFFDDFDGYENGAQNQGYDVIGTLIHACLLEEVSKYEVKMHDVIRDMALSIACNYGKSKNKFFVQAGVQMTEAPEVSKWQGVERMSLMDNEINTLKETPTCPQLSTLLLGGNRHLEMTKTGFFHSMHALKVLDLSYCRLRNLQLDISKLTSLQYLNLRNSNLEHWPIGLENLAQLKCLDLDGTEYLVPPPPQVISKLSSLQVLDMFGSGTFDTSKCVNEALLEELSDLRCLNHLGVTISNDTAFGKLSSSIKLQNCLRSLCLVEMSNFTIFALSNMRRLEFLEFLKCDDIEIDNPRNSEISSPQSFQSLRFIWIVECQKIKSLTWIINIPNLRRIVVCDCMNLEEVIGGGKWMDAEGDEKISKLFENLQALILNDLPKLESIFPGNLLFPCLENLCVRRCPELKKLPLDSKSAKGSRRLGIKGEKTWFDALEWKDEATRNAFLPHFSDRMQVNPHPSPSDYISSQAFSFIRSTVWFEFAGVRLKIFDSLQVNCSSMLFA